MSKTNTSCALLGVFLLLTATIASQPNDDGLFGAMECPETQVYQSCGRYCNRTCEDGPEYTGGSCRRVCVSKCGCPAERPVLHKERCIEFSECPPLKETNDHNKTIHAVLCPKPQVYQECGSACNRTCKHGRDGVIACQRICLTRCACPPEKPVWHKEKCVAYEECLRKPDGGSRSLPPKVNSEETKKKLTSQGIANILSLLG